ncbi:hypothetical protein [Embleya sp. NPDC020630]|uniref:hypothetical protein n=1 Tax=Embleya sp. NPDC020630 TaxID=3363979 RepID=UPI0037BDBC4E
MSTVRCARRRAIGAAVLNGVIATILLSPMSEDHMSIRIAVNGLVAVGWTTALALTFRRVHLPDATYHRQG